MLLQQGHCAAAVLTLWVSFLLPQVRAPDTAASAGTGDGMEEALQYLEACGERWDMARTQSTDAMLGGSTAEPRLLGTTLRCVQWPGQQTSNGVLGFVACMHRPPCILVCQLVCQLIYEQQCCSTWMHLAMLGQGTRAEWMPCWVAAQQSHGCWEPHSGECVGRHSGWCAPNPYQNADSN